MKTKSMNVYAEMESIVSGILNIAVFVERNCYGINVGGEFGMTIKEIKPISKEDTCKNCPVLDVNYNSDESYCNLADGEEVRLKRGQHRPEWCPKRVS